MYRTDSGRQNNGNRRADPAGQECHSGPESSTDAGIDPEKCYPDSFYGSLESIESRFRKELTRTDDKHLRSELTSTESKNVTTGVMRFDSIF